MCRQIEQQDVGNSLQETGIFDDFHDFGAIQTFGFPEKERNGREEGTFLRNLNHRMSFLSAHLINLLGMLFPFRVHGRRRCALRYKFLDLSRALSDLFQALSVLTVDE